MALEQLVNGMTGQQLANTIKNNFDKVLDVESAENKAENAGKALKTDYDATRYVEMELADGTPIRMRWDVFCQAIASVVAGNIGHKIFDAKTVEGEEIYICDIDTESFVFSFQYNNSKRMGLYFAKQDGLNDGVTTIADVLGFSVFFDGFTVKNKKLYLSAKASQSVVIYRMTSLF